MADISIVARLLTGVQRNVDLASNTLVVNVVKVGGGAGTDLTKAILDNLITLQNGSDIANTLHHHDGRYFTETELGSALAASGSDLIGDDNNYSNFTPAAATVKGALSGIDTALATAGGTEFADDVFAIQDNGDATKQIQFQAAGITTSTIRTITMPDTDVDLGQIATNTSDISTNTAAIALRALDADVIKKDGSVAFTGDQAMGGFKLTGLAAPVSDSDAARKVDVDAAAAGMLPKAPVDLATTGNITLSGEQTIDGTLTSTSRVLVQEQTDLTENGIYVTAAGAWARASDADGTPSSEIQGGNSVFVNGGTANGNTVFRLAGSGVIVPDVGDQDWIVYSRAEAVSASNGLTKVGLDIQMASGAAGDGLAFAAGVLSVNVDDSTIETNADTLRLKAGGILNSHVNASAAIAESKLDLDFATATLNTNITTHTSNTSNPHSVTKAQVLSGDLIVNADIDAAAAIVTTKLADATELAEAVTFFANTDMSGAEAETLTDASNADALHQHAVLIENKVVGEAMPASGPVAVRMGIVPVAGETEGRIYKADPTELSVGGVDPFHVIGIGIAASQAVAGNMDIVKLGKMTVTAHGFAIGLPIFLDSAGALTGTAPTTSGEAAVKVGMAVDTNTIEVQIQIMGVN